MPIYNGQRQVIGVAQLINKVLFFLIFKPDFKYFDLTWNIFGILQFLCLIVNRRIINRSRTVTPIHLKPLLFSVDLEFIIHNCMKEHVSDFMEKLLPAEYNAYGAVHTGMWDGA